jgi:hypothetical protein
MTVSELVLPYYKTDKVSQKIAKAIDDELFELTKLIYTNYLPHIQTDFRRAESDITFELVPQIIEDYEKLFNVIINGARSKPEILYKLCLMHQMSNIAISDEILETFIKWFVKSTGLDETVWNLDKLNLPNNNVFVHVQYTVDTEYRYKTEMENLQSFLRLILPANLVVEFKKATNLWSTFSGIRKWDHFKNNKMDWESVKNSLI